MNERRQHLEQRLTRLFDLDPRQARMIVEEVIDGMGGTVDEFIADRHAELQRLGWKNPRIYAQIREELAELRFEAPPLTERQIRRRIYG